MKPQFAILATFLTFQLFSPIETNAEEVVANETKTTVSKKKFFTGYNFMLRQFEGQIKSDYSVFPESLEVTTHHFSLGYYLSENWLFNITGKHIKNDIELVRSFGGQVVGKMPASTEGLGDTLVGLSYYGRLSPNSFYILNGDISLPTGDYQKKDYMGAYISYPGQLGSGTVDFAPAASLHFRDKQFDLMVRGQGRVRTGRNDLNYRLGDEIMAVASGGYWFVRYAALTASLYYKNWREVEGAENILAYNNDARRAFRAAGASHQGPPSAGTGRPGAPSAGAGTGHQGPPSTGSTHASGGPRSSAGPSAPVNNGDIFAAPGARWSAQVGVKTGIYLGPTFRGVLEVGIPVYNDQLGPLTGLDAEWYAMSSIRSEF